MTNVPFTRTLLDFIVEPVSPSENLAEYTERQLTRLQQILIGASLEDWHTVDSGNEPAFENSWVNYDTNNFHGAAFYKDFMGIVHIRGLVKSGTVSTGSTGTVFTLPLGYRPSLALAFAVDSNGAHGQLLVGVDGSVKAAAGSNVAFGLNCSFRLGDRS